MSRVSLYAKSNIREGKDWAEANGTGSVRSDNVATERALADDFAGCVDRNTEIAYDIHMRSRR